MAQDYLRFLTCGSVDDGKSTLIGRLLYDAGLVCEDQLAGLVTDGKEPDCSLLLDGLLAEREQGITIDVAYRHFATPKRHFMVADSPGHEEYTPNMVTAASQAQLAVLLTDASKGLLVQTRRHAAIAHLMGIGTVLLAVNKMDLADYSEQVFQKISLQFKAVAMEMGIPDATCLPVCATSGDNVVRRSPRMPWYTGPTLLEWLENVDPVRMEAELPFRMAVQWVNRPDSQFRGVSGTVAAGSVKLQDTITVLDTGVTSRVKRILGPDGDIPEAAQGEPVTLVFENDVDASRGHLLAAAQEKKPLISKLVEAELIWMDREPLQTGRSFLFKRGPVERSASVSALRGRLNLYTFKEEPVELLGFNEQGNVELKVTPPLFFEPYADDRRLGHGILIDRISGNTVGALLLRNPVQKEHNVSWHNFSVDKSARLRQKNQKTCVLWFTGLSGAGKSTVADRVERKLFELDKHTFILDGDNVRHGLNSDLGFSASDRVENIRRVAEVAKLMTDAGLIVLVTFISPYAADRRMARALFPEGEFFEIFVDTPLNICMKRDAKGLYQKALTGEISEMTGLSAPYEKPENPDLVLHGGEKDPDMLADEVIALIRYLR